MLFENSQNKTGCENIELTAGLLFTIALIMIGTYTCSAIIFPEDTTNYMGTYDRFAGASGQEVTFDVFLDLNFELAFQRIFNGVVISDRRVYSSVTYWYIYENYKVSIQGWLKPELGIFDGYEENKEGAGRRWYNSEWTQGGWIWEFVTATTRAKNIEIEYHKYLQNIGFEEKPQGNLIDTISIFLTNVWEGFTQLLRLLTFTNIPNMPVWVVMILNVFFIPMWIVLIIGIAPYVVEIIKAISSFVQSWLPW